MILDMCQFMFQMVTMVTIVMMMTMMIMVMMVMMAMDFPQTHQATKTLMIRKRVTLTRNLTTVQWNTRRVRCRLWPLR